MIYPSSITSPIARRFSSIARRVLSEFRQVLLVFDQGAWAKGTRLLQVPLDISRRVYESVRDAIIYSAGLDCESKGHLKFVHSVKGVRTLKDEFDKVAAHNEHHLETASSRVDPALFCSPGIDARARRRP